MPGISDKLTDRIRVKGFSEIVFEMMLRLVIKKRINRSKLMNWDQTERLKGGKDGVCVK